MKYKLPICAVILLAVAAASAQVASHAPTAVSQPARPGTPAPAMVITGKPVARVNGSVLTDRDLQREMFSIFPYARQHNGNIPQEMEPQIRNGAMQMIIFEELVYQEAQRRKITISRGAPEPGRSGFSQAVFQPGGIQQFCTKRVSTARSRR